MPQTKHFDIKREIGACVVTFQREEDSPWEYGIAILEDTATYDVKVIIDMDGVVVPSMVWKYFLKQWEGSFRFIEWNQSDKKKE